MKQRGTAHWHVGRLIRKMLVTPPELGPSADILKGMMQNEARKTEKRAQRHAN
jgi:hypothetical protein